MVRVSILIYPGKKFEEQNEIKYLNKKEKKNNKISQHKEMW